MLRIATVAACLIGSAFQHRKGQLLPVATSKSHMRACIQPGKTHLHRRLRYQPQHNLWKADRLRQLELAQLQVLQIHSPGVASLPLGDGMGTLLTAHQKVKCQNTFVVLTQHCCHAEIPQHFPHNRTVLCIAVWFCGNKNTRAGTHTAQGSLFPALLPSVEFRTSQTTIGWSQTDHHAQQGAAGVAIKSG